MKVLLALTLVLSLLFANDVVNSAIDSFNKEEELFKEFAKDETGRKSLAATRYQYAKEFLQNTKYIDIKSQEYNKALLYSESATKLDSSKSEYWLTYATLLLALQNVQDAQITAEIASEIALDLDSKNYTKSKMILLQSFINQLQFHKAMQTMEDILHQEPVLMNHPKFIDAYISAYVISGEIEEGMDRLHFFLLEHPSSYGAMIASVKLYEIGKKDLAYDKKAKQNVVELKEQLKSIYKKFKTKLPYGAVVYMESILAKGELK